MATLKLELDAQVIQHFESVLTKEGRKQPLRIAVRKSHCMGGRGHSYELNVAAKKEENDAVVQSAGFEFFVDPDSACNLGTVTLSLEKAVLGSWLRIENSKSTGTCPCGRHDLLGEASADAGADGEHKCQCH